MKTVFSVLILTLMVVVSLPAQHSDRAIVDKFEKTVKELNRIVDSAKAVQDCADISASVAELEKEFDQHKELLDKALYPDDYAKTIMNLKGHLMVRQKDIGVIEIQLVRISELETQVRELSGKIDKLSADNERLMNDAKNLNATAASMQATVTSNKALFDSLNQVIGKLRQNLKERDDLIFSLLDSLFMQYDKSVTSMNDVEKSGVYGKLERRNVLTNIKKSISDNLAFLESTTLTPADFAQIAKQHQKFSSQWKGIGPKLASIYLTGKQKKNEVAMIDTMLATWSTKVDQSTWKALAALLSKNGVELKPFANGNEFSNALIAFVDNEISNPKKEADDVRLKRFNTFNDGAWNTDLKTTWLPVMAESGKITKEQKETIEKKVEAWHGAVTPVSWLTYLLIILLIILVVWALMRYTRKSPAVKK
jgi:uncharacterized coiled-coil DUF342 family protein